VYDVILTTGRHLASIALPASDRVLWAGDGEVMVLGRDSLDVQHVRIHRILEAAPPR